MKLPLLFRLPQIQILKNSRMIYHSAENNLPLETVLEMIEDEREKLEREKLEREKLEREEDFWNQIIQEEEENKKSSKD